MVEIKKRSNLLPYEKAISHILFLYRFFAFGIAVIILQVLPLGTFTPAPNNVYVMLSIIGAYSVIRFITPFRWQQRGSAGYILLFGDLILCILFILVTDGLDSGFLLYSLIPIITASLLFEQKISLGIATILCISLTIAHLGISQFNNNFAWILEENYLVLLIIYVIVCFLISTLTYRTNLNVYQHIEREAILEERRRIGREIHDSIAQALAYLKLKTTITKGYLSKGETDKTLTGLNDMQKVSEDAYQDVREIIDSLSTKVIDLHLIPSLSEYIRIFEKRTGIQTEFQHPENPIKLLPLAELQLLRIAQESLTNIRKHSQASQVRLHIEDSPKLLVMAIEDNGQGISSDNQGDETHHGLKIMRERANSIGAVLDIDTTSGQGTKIIVKLPK